MIRALLIVLMLVPTVAGAADPTGRASVIDGDTLEIHGQRIRLHGVDAPEENGVRPTKREERRSVVL